MSMRVALLGGRGFDSSYGGVENAVTEISQLLATRFDVVTEVYGYGKKARFDVERRKGVMVVSAPRWVGRCGHSATVFLCCIYSLTFRRPDVIIFFAAGPCLLSVVAKIFRVKTIACLRKIDSANQKHGRIGRLILRAGEAAAVTVADICTVNGRYLQEHFRTPTREPVFIPNGASESSAGDDEILIELGIMPGEYILSASRLDPCKRIDVLLSTYQHVSRRGRFPLIIAGGQCTDASYEQWLRTLAVEGVIFTGHLSREKIDPLTRNAGVFVLTSEDEGMSNSLLAAMKAGRCVVCSDIQANRDTVENSPLATFRLNDTDALAKKLDRYIADEQARKACGDQMHEIAERCYSWMATTEQYWGLIRSLHENSEATLFNTTRER